ncbi:MAG: DNA-directed RNA polymerase subunit beta, partial [Dehalococcoidia bacterium]
MTVDRRIVQSIRTVPSMVHHYGKSELVLEMPYLIQMSKDSYKHFLDVSLRTLFDEITPIDDFTGGRMELRFGEYHLEEPKYTEQEARLRDRTYDAPLRINVQLEIKETGEIKEQELFLGDLPLMTEHGTFIINGAERVVVSQLVRSPGVYFTATPDPATGRRLTAAKLIPNRGAWLEFETDKKNVLYVKVDRKRRIPVSVLLRAIDMDDDKDDEELGSDDVVRAMLQDVDIDPDHRYVDATLDKDPTENRRQALEEFYRRLRPGDPPTAENARNLLDQLFFTERRYDLGRVGRYQLNKRLAFTDAPETRTLRVADLVAIVRKMIDINNSRGDPDDID